MASGYILIFAVLILGGVIATVGDRLGTRVGKARLSLFNLRPRRTATLVTILTGTIISASTLGILFAASDPLRTGVFELRTIERKLRRTRSALEEATKQKTQVEAELAKARSTQAEAQQQLAGTQQQLAGTQKQLQETDQSLKVAVAERSRAQAESTRIQARFQQAQNQLATVSQQISRLRAEISQLQTERNQVIAEREKVIAEREKVIAAREEEIRVKDAVIQQREARLKELETQQAFLAREIEKLEQEAQGLRQGNVAIQRGQVLASAVVRIVNPVAAQQAIDQLLREANRSALKLTRPGISDSNQIIQITRLEVERLIEQINDGRDYVIRISAAANYLTGETPIQVFADAVPNQVVFLAGDVVAATSIDPSSMTSEQIQERINLLLAAANFRARRQGLLSSSVEIGRIQNLISFIEQLKQYSQTLELRAVAADITYTAGPLRLEFTAVQNGEILLRSQDQVPRAGQ